MRSLASPAALLLTLAVTQSTYAQYGFEDFLKAVESGQQNNARLNSPRLAQLPTGPEELPPPRPSLPETGDTFLESAPPSPSDLQAPAPGTANSKITAPGTAPGINKPMPQASIPESPQPVPLYSPSPDPAPNLSMPVLPQIDFEEAFAQQDIGLSESYGVQASPGSDCNCHGRFGASHASCTSGGCSTRSCNVMAHYPADLPPPSTLRGYFNASPCIANVWDGYACEAAKECQKTQHHIQGGQILSGCGHKTKCE